MVGTSDMKDLIILAFKKFYKFILMIILLTDTNKNKILTLTMPSFVTTIDLSW